MFFIAAMDANTQGMGFDGKLAWTRQEGAQDMQHFQAKTAGKNIVVGHTTAVGLPPLKNRYVMVLRHREDVLSQNGNEYTWDELCQAVEKMETRVEDGKDSVVICGGLATYLLMMREPRLRKHLTHGYISHINATATTQYDTYLTEFYDLVRQEAKYATVTELLDGTKVETFVF